MLRRIGIYIYPNTLYILTKEYEQYIKDNNVEKGVLPDEVAEDLFKTAIVNWSYYLHNPLKSLYKKEGKLLQCKINSKSG